MTAATGDSGGRLRFGLELTTREGRYRDGRIPTWTELRGMARQAEQAGFDVLWVEDHLIQRGVDYFGKPLTETGFWECFTLLAALAEATERAALAPYVACTGFRNPALLAKMADTLDEVSGGRLILALGAGWHEPEYTAFGFPYDHRASRFEEALNIIVPLLRTGHVDFEGRFYQARDCELRPRSPRPQGPPIWVGGRGPRLLALAARHAEGIDTYGHTTVGTVAEPLARYDAACREAGRDPAAMVHSVCAYVTVPGPDGDLTGLRQPAMMGTPAELAEQFRAFERAGANYLSFVISPGDERGIERIAPALEAYRRAGA